MTRHSLIGYRKLGHVAAWVFGLVVCGSSWSQAADIGEKPADATVLQNSGTTESALKPVEQPLSEVVVRIDQRYGQEGGTESPDFRQHIIPLMGKLGCNGRACHGSFQGQGGFRLSLFGYDFKSDHDNMTGGDEPRINKASPLESLVLQKPLTLIPHEGGERLKTGTWQYRVFAKWLTDGAKPLAPKSADFARLEITPSEMVARQKGDHWQLQVVAVWADGVREDVTPLCRFQSNNEQIATISESGLVTAMGPGDTHVVTFYDNGVVPTPVIHPVTDKIGPNYPDAVTPTRVDELVVQKLRKLGIVQSETCSDSDFLRRVSLDIVGTLPTPQEVEAFLSDSAADKRSRKVNELLERPEYAAWWATKMADWTGNNARYQQQQAIGRDQTSQEWYAWLRTRFAENQPYDQMIEGIVLAKSRFENETYADYCERMSGYYKKGAAQSYSDQPSLTHYWSRNNFRNPDDRALGFAYTFLGVRIQCAQCHKHPFDQWTKDDFDRFKGFFTRVSYGQTPQAKADAAKMMAELGIDPKTTNANALAKALQPQMAEGKIAPFFELYVPEARKVDVKAKKPGKENPKRPRVVAGRTATVLGGEEIKIDAMDDPRTALMDWMRDEDNPYFSQAIVNRVWASYFHRGIVEPTDDLSLANPPCNEQLLSYLASSFREHGYDLKWLHREICNSRTYQLSWVNNETNRLDERNFSRAVPRRLPAEVAYDAMVQATSSDQQVKKVHSDLRGRAIAEPIVNTNATGRGQAGYALTVFGRSIRESNCDCDRSAETSLLQTVYLQNDQQVLNELTEKGGWIDEVLKTGVKADETDTSLKEALRNVDRLETAMDRAKTKGNPKRVAQLTAALKEAKAAAAKLQKVENSSPQVTFDEAVIPHIVRQAYLRTLSRNPTETELGRSVSYFNETGDLKIGTRDLLWALINTKEFIVNH